MEMGAHFLPAIFSLILEHALLASDLEMVTYTGLKTSATLPF